MKPGRRLVAIGLMAVVIGGLPAFAGARKSKGKWVLMSAEGAPPAAQHRITVWTGEQMLVFSEGGGGAFDPGHNRWRSIQVQGLPPALLKAWDDLHDRPILAGDKVVFLVSELLAGPSGDPEFVGAIYDIRADRWTELPRTEHAPSPRKWPVTVWTGEGVIVWGGVGKTTVEVSPTRSQTLADGAVLELDSMTWSPMSAEGAPSPRSSSAGVWTGSQLVVWGGLSRQNSTANLACQRGSCDAAEGGALYDPATDSWLPMNTEGGPYPRALATMMMADGAVVVFGGRGAHGGPMASGGVYHPGSDSWTAIEGGPGVEGHPSSAIDGGCLVVHGSKHNAAIYDFESRQWRKASRDTLPPPSGWATHAIGDPGMLRIATPRGGEDGLTGSIARIDVASGAWRAAPFPAGLAPVPLNTLSAIWTGEQLIFWGGSTMVEDPDGRNGCEGADRPCTPVIPTMQVWSSDGAMFTPVFEAR